ncbi:MAG: response regulator [Planctomycetes bacterium]|nr:response regulator [Planctomycetota bacterium]
MNDSRMKKKTDSSRDETAIFRQVSSRKPHVLIAEDDAEFRSLLTSSFEEDGFVVNECPDGTQLFTKTAGSILDRTKPKFDLIVSDVRMPGYTGIEFLSRLNIFQWRIPIILITAFGDDDIHAKALELGASAIMDKPFEIESLIWLARQALGMDRGP